MGNQTPKVGQLHLLLRTHIGPTVSLIIHAAEEPDKERQRELSVAKGKEDADQKDKKWQVMI